MIYFQVPSLQARLFTQMKQFRAHRPQYNSLFKEYQFKDRHSIMTLLLVLYIDFKCRMNLRVAAQ